MNHRYAVALSSSEVIGYYHHDITELEAKNERIRQQVEAWRNEAMRLDSKYPENEGNIGVLNTCNDVLDLLDGGESDAKKG